MQHLLLSLPQGDTRDVGVLDRPLMEIADDLGLTHEAYYRALAALSVAAQDVGKQVKDVAASLTVAVLELPAIHGASNV